LVEYHGNYVKDHFVGTLGGQVQQLYYIIDEVVKRNPQGLKMYMQKKVENTDTEYFTRANNIRELMLPEHLNPFLMVYLKNMLNEAMEITLHPICVKYLAELECPLDDLT
jgi:hypothetical protein